MLKHAGHDKKNVRATRCSVLPPPSRARHSLISPLVILPLMILPLGVFDVCVATNFVKMMKRKKITRNKSSNSHSSSLILLAMASRTIFALFSRSLVRRNSVVPCSCRRLARICVVGLKSFLALTGPAWRSSSLHANVMVHSYRCLCCHVAM